MRKTETGLAMFFVVLITGLVYWPVLSNGFVNWDDPTLFNDPYLGSSGLKSLKIFFSYNNGIYDPLCHLLVADFYRLWGLNPLPFHAVGFVVHLAMTAGVFLAALRLLRLILTPAPGEERTLVLASLIAALLFSLHPLQAEAVASIYFPDTITCALVLYALIAYLDQRRRLSLALLLISGLWRYQGAGLPAVLLALNIYPLKRLSGDPRKWISPETRGVWLELTPFIVISATIFLINAYGKARGGFHLLGARGFETAGLFFYLWKWLVPMDFMPVYVLRPTNPLGWSVIESSVAALVVTAGLFIMRRRWPAKLLAWACYIVGLAPTLGFSSDGPMYGHDHYAYLAGLVFPLLAAAEFFQLRKKLLLPAMVALALVLAGIGRLAYDQVQVWRDAESLWRHALAVDPSSPFANYRLACLRWVERKPYAAIYYFRQQTRGAPKEGAQNVALAYNSLAAELNRQGRTGEAIKNLKEALRYQPDLPLIQDNLRAIAAAKQARSR